MPDKQYLTAVSYHTTFHSCTSTGPAPIKSMLAALLSTSCELSLDDLKGAAELLNKKLSELQNCAEDLYVLYGIKTDGTLAVTFDSVYKKPEIIEELKRTVERWPSYQWRIAKIVEL